MPAPDLFINPQGLLNGPWQAFERDVARLMVCNGFEDVRIVGGSGDRGGDVLGVKNGQLWVVQCKFTSNSYPPPQAVDEVVSAGMYYGAERLVVAVSRPGSPALHAAIEKWKRLGHVVELLSPSTLIELARQAPEYAPSRRPLRDYQEEAVEKMLASLRETGRSQIVLATGLGKTVVMAETVAQLFRDEVLENRRVLVLADKRELVDQLQRAFWDQLPKTICTHRLIAGEEPSYWDGVIFGTVQTVVNRTADLPAIDLLLVDEAHHIGAETFRSVIRELDPRMLGGVTATPWRGDQYDIDQLLGQPVFQLGISEGLRRGFLCEADYRLLADNIDWEFVRTHSAQKYSLKELNKLLLIPTRDEEAARTIREAYDIENRSAVIVFSPSVEHARTFAAILRLYEFKASHIDGGMPQRERERVMLAFRKGQLNAITTVDIFNEGVDVPNVDMIVFMRVTHSRRIFVQQLGRGLRIAPNKSKVVVLDFVSDLRRISEVLELSRSSRGEVERFDLRGGIVQFRDVGARSFMLEWMKDQADLFAREGDATLEVPKFDFPEPARGGRVQ